LNRFTNGQPQNETTKKGRTTMNTKRKTARSASVTEGSGNVFVDLGLPNAGQELMKARLTLQIYRIQGSRHHPDRSWENPRHSAAPCLGVGAQSFGQFLGRPPY
jgi:hypothetical protein